MVLRSWMRPASAFTTTARRSPLQTNLIAASFVDSDPRAMSELITFVDRKGIRVFVNSQPQPPILKISSCEREVFRHAGGSAVYVLYTPDMLLAIRPCAFLALRMKAPQR